MSDSVPRGCYGWVRGIERPSKVGVASTNVDHGGGFVIAADLDDLLTALIAGGRDPAAPTAYGAAHRSPTPNWFVWRSRILLDCPSERRFPALCDDTPGTCFRTCPSSPATTAHARAGCRSCGSQRGRLRLAVVVRQRQVAGLHAGALRGVARDRQALGLCRSARLRLEASHSRYFWGFRLHAARQRRDARSRSSSPGQRPERGRRRDARTRRPRGLHRDRRQGLCR